MRLRYSPPRDLSISGSAAELEAARQQILQLSEPNGPDTLRIEAQTDGDPSPYTQWLSELVVARGAGPVRAEVLEHTTLEILGAPDLLAAFASFWQFAPDAPQGAHFHHEYLDDSTTVAPDSLPLVIEVE
jgi:hypothetical protein